MRRRLCFLTKGHDVYKGFRERKDIKSILPHYKLNEILLAIEESIAKTALLLVVIDAVFNTPIIFP